MRRLLLLLLLVTLPLVLAAPIDSRLEQTGTVTVTSADPNGISVTFYGGDTGGGGGGGGGGGSGGGANSCFISNPSTSHIFDILMPGETYTLKSFSNQFMFKKVTFKVLTNHTGVTFKLSHVLTIACETVPAVGTDLDSVGYERIDYIGIDPDQITDVTINFTITDDTLQGVNAQDVKLYRYHNSNWEAAPTSYLGKVDGEHRFLATPPGMSMFSIAVPAPDVVVPQPTTQPPNEITGDVTAPPEEEPDSVNTGSSTFTSKTKRFKTSWFSLIVVLIIGGALGGYYAYDYRRKIQEVNEAAAKGEVEHTPMIGIAEIDEEALKDPIDQVHDYVDKELRHGHTREEIAAHLEKSGWPKDVIEQVIDDFRPQYLAKRGMLPHDDYEHVLVFLKEKLDKGYSDRVIKQSLVSAGWDEGLITALLGDLTGRNAKLVAYIETQREAKKSDEEIKQVLVNAGWGAEAIKRAFEPE
ncbi:PGF-pre-PGF domain-containing protein [Candidatus Woesearchaeota archaeon]|nr:PGF-pre-PGF domain-containing protein [Candidatus Woesearchaeota archaeon]